VFNCIRQEDFGAQDAEAVNYCREKVQASDIFLGLTGQRRGWEPDGDSTMRSISEMEHDWAKQAGVRRFLYVAPDDFPVPGDLRETDEQYARQQAFRRRLMEGGERVVSQRGFENPERFAADIAKHLLTQVVTGDLITRLRPELSARSPGSLDEQQPAVAAAVERLVEDQDVDLLALAKNPKDVDLTDLEIRLRARAEEQERRGKAALRSGAQYWRHIGALAFLHNTPKSLIAYHKAVALDPLDPEGWRFLGELQYRSGEFHLAEQSFDRVLSLGKSTEDLKTQAIGCMRLGWISREHGDLTRTEALATQAVRSAEAAGWQEGMARAYGNLGNIYVNRGNLDEAEEMQRKALALNEQLGRKEGMARAYGNLGNIYWTRGNPDEAEKMHLKSLALHEEWGNREGMAIVYSNLGDIYQARHDLDRAEAMYRKSLTLNEELGVKEGKAAAYGDLGDIYRSKGNKAEMCECWRKARGLYREMGLQNKVAEVENRLKLNACGNS
jgi:tetratricopeptide (TPR) repeat protein